jgi:uncharacterized RDD family membrane protein YckC
MNQDNPYAPPGATILEPAQPDDPGTAALAGRWLRLGGALIDGVINLVIILPMMYFGGFFDYLGKQPKPDTSTSLLWAAIGFAVFLLLQGYPLLADGQTWAKKWLGMKIVDLDGRKPEFLRLASLRYLPTQLIALIPMVGPFYSVVSALFIFGDERRCLHDWIAGTRVVLVR